MDGPSHLPSLLWLHPHMYIASITKTSRGSIAFTKSTKAFFLQLMSWWTMKIASVVLIPAINPNSMLSIFTIFFVLPLMTLPKTFIASSINFMSLYEPQVNSQRIPFTFVDIHQPTLTPALRYPSYHFPFGSNLTRSLPHLLPTTLDGPTALLDFIPPIAAPTSDTIFYSPHTGLTFVRPSLSQANSSFDSLS